MGYRVVPEPDCCSHDPSSGPLRRRISLSAIEVLANSKADHGPALLEAGPASMPVLCHTALATVATTYTAYIVGTIDGGAFVGDAGYLPSAAIPANGSATELLDARTSSIG
ncbi:hypothetical protein [Prauserella cavernicola]|uniref:Uncharacterized protein n=1 Tax=Prauserella cavernicola TaxID=2800127 RepID=A0A934QXU0_9PSEU|nr:hypothetical protein [Prauserella cavernicola]MBK1787259.1 hypothetical protein [Prauserella cavernicola]